MAKAWQMKLANSSRKLVLVKLADNAGDDGRCWPSYAYLAAQCEMSERTVIRHINDLVLTGFVKRTHRYGGAQFNKTNIFQLTLENGDISNLKALKEAEKKAKNNAEKETKNPTENADFRGDNLSCREIETEVTNEASRGDKQCTFGVTNSTFRGDTGSPRTINEPSIEPSIEPSCSKRRKKPGYIREIFDRYPAHRRGGTDQLLWKTWKQENLTEDDATKLLDWLTRAAQSDPQWGTDANGQFVNGIIKFIRERKWLTPIPVARTNNQNRPNEPDFHSGDTSWANDIGL